MKSLLNTNTLGVWVSLSVAACGGASATGGSQAAATVSPTAAVAAKLGISETYVTGAVDAAKAALGAGTKPEEKAAAAQVGVDKASAQAQTDGKPLTDEQKTGLVESLKGLL